MESKVRKGCLNKSAYFVAVFLCSTLFLEGEGHEIVSFEEREAKQLASEWGLDSSKTFLKVSGEFAVKIKLLD